MARVAIVPKPLPSIGATTSTFAPFVISCSACDCCVVAEFCAFRTSMLIPGASFFSAFTNVGLSKPFQRGVTLSGRRNATRPDALLFFDAAVVVVARARTARAPARTSTPPTSPTRRLQRLWWDGFICPPCLVTVRRPTIGALAKLFNADAPAPARLVPSRVERFYRGGALNGRARARRPLRDVDGPAREAPRPRGADSSARPSRPVLRRREARGAIREDRGV